MTKFHFCLQVSVSNLPFEASWQDLKDHMRQAGNVLYAKIFVGDDGSSEGWGTVEYSRPFEVGLSKAVVVTRPLSVAPDVHIQYICVRHMIHDEALR